MKKLLFPIFVYLGFICSASSAVSFIFTGSGNQFATMDGEAQASGTVDGTKLTLKATSALNFNDDPNKFSYLGDDHGFMALYKNDLTFTMEFDKPVKISKFTFENVSGFNINDALGFELLIGGVKEKDVTVTDFALDNQFADISTVTLSTPLTVQANTEVTFKGVVPSSYANGVFIGMHNMEVDVVPEPASYALGLGLSTVLFIAVLRRRIKKAHAQN
jgi:hypothetical protein